MTERRLRFLYDKDDEGCVTARAVDGAARGKGRRQLRFNPSTASQAVIRPDYHAYTQPRYKNLPSPYKINRRTRLKYARGLAD